MHQTADTSFPARRGLGFGLRMVRAVIFWHCSFGWIGWWSGVGHDVCFRAGPLGCGRPYALLGTFSDGFGFSGFPAQSTFALVAVLFGFHRLKRFFEFSFHLPERLSDLNHMFRLPVFFITEHGPGEHCDLSS